MAQTVISVRVDEDIKKDVEALYDELGLNISIAINMFFRQSLLERAIPFPIKAKDAETSKQARQSLKDIFREMQEQSVINGTDKMTMDEIDTIIAESRQEKRAVQ